MGVPPFQETTTCLMAPVNFKKPLKTTFTGGSPTFAKQKFVKPRGSILRRRAEVKYTPSSKPLPFLIAVWKMLWETQSLDSTDSSHQHGEFSTKLGASEKWGTTINPKIQSFITIVPTKNCRKMGYWTPDSPFFVFSGRTHITKKK